MRFAEPHWLHLLWTLPIFGILLVAALRRRERDLERWCAPGLWPRMVPVRSPWAPYLKSGMLLLALAFLVVAAARPQIGSRIVTVTRSGIDVVVALDTSESMLAEDLEPNRITRARQEMLALIERLRGDRIGLVAFAGDAFVQCPLTLDYAAARLFIRLMEPGLVPVPGTAIARAITVATAAFNEEENKFKALVLITDGEDHEGRMLDAARAAREKGVRIFAVGMGSEEGEPIPVRDASGNVRDYKRDENGEVVLTRQDPAGLAAVCEETGGRYFDGKAGGPALDQLYGEIAGMEEREMEGGVVTEYEDRYGYFVAIALLLLVLEWLWTERSRLRRRRAGAIAATWILALTGAAHADEGRSAYREGDYARARDAYESYSVEHPEDPRGYYNLGTTLHQTGELAPAQHALQRALLGEDEALQAQALYNLGNTYAKTGELTEARDAYRAALRIDPDDRDTKVNLELINRILESQPPDSTQQQQQSQSGGEDGEQDPESQDPSEDSPPQDSDGRQDQTQDRDPQDPETQDGQQQQSGDESSDPQNQQMPEDEPEPQSGEESAEQKPEDSEGPSRPMPEDLKIPPEEARRLLEALGQREEQIQAERMKVKAKNIQVEKDW